MKRLGLAFLIVACAGLSTFCVDPIYETSSSSSSGSSSSATSSTGQMCSEQPCKLVAPQCGCPSGQMCTTSDVNGTRTCIVAGAQQVGQACSPSNDCVPGSRCSGTPKSLCRSFCSVDSDCTPPGGACLVDIVPLAPGVSVCTQNCDPTTNEGCSVTGFGCQAQRDPTSGKAFTICLEDSGAGTQNSLCQADVGNCAPNFDCVSVGGGPYSCVRWCKVAQGCAGGLQCVHFAPPMLIGSTEYGTCE